MTHNADTINVLFLSFPLHVAARVSQQWQRYQLPMHHNALEHGIHEVIAHPTH